MTWLIISGYLINSSWSCSDWAAKLKIGFLHILSYSLLISCMVAVSPPLSGWCSIASSLYLRFTSSSELQFEKKFVFMVFVNIWLKLFLKNLWA